MNLNGIALYSIVVTIISAFSPLKRPTFCKNAGEKVKNRLCLHILSLMIRGVKLIRVVLLSLNALPFDVIPSYLTID